MAKSTTGKISGFTKALVGINKELTEANVRDLKDICSLSDLLDEDELQSVTSALSLFRVLHVSQENTLILEELLLNIERADLISKYLNATTTDKLPPVATKQLETRSTDISCIDMKDDVSSGLGLRELDGTESSRYPADITVVGKSTPFRASPTREDRPTASDASPDFNPDEEKHELRDYQKELARPALEGNNTIICAPTGCGKTITAAEICKHHHDNHHDPKKFKALFIVNIRHLTSQQRKAFETHFDMRDLGALKEMETLEAVLQIKKVVMITAQILVNALERKDVELSFFDMLIFDECHHTTLNHPYNTIMRNYLLKKKEGLSRLPFILGLSASLGVGEDGDAAKHIVTLCANMNANCVSHVREHLQDLEDHVRTPEDDKICIVNPRPANDKFRNIIVDIMNDLEAMHVGDSRHEKGTQEYENWIIQRRMDAEKLHDRQETVIAGYLLAFNNALVLYDNTRAIDAIGLLDGYFNEKRSIAKEHIDPEADLREDYEDNHESKLRDIAKKETTNNCPMLKKLTELLKMIFTKKHESKGIILCRTRQIVQSITDFLKQEEALKRYNIRPDYLVGQGKAENTMNETEQAKVLKRFKDEKINILVATDIAQEGLDMPACNVVIRYNFVSNEIGTVQSRGRARASGKCYLIVERGSRNEKHEYGNREKVIRMKEALVQVDHKSNEEFNEEVRIRQNELIKEYEDELSKKKETQMLDRASDVEVLCKECSQFFCYASDLRENGSNITCVLPEFKEKIREIKQGKQVYRTTDTIGYIKCAKDNCGQQLGILITYKGITDVKGYGLKAQSLKFQNPKKVLNSTWTLKKWKKRTFKIELWEP
ncbi:ATP-dependent RNA helicase DHX58-like [Antedon mediterranea]|uniref:ATP-dependent RNA helicase DHX58-like n=1 Tax=Antedon mediterranea TaxID=105859 RepID=UPI003AF42485